MLVSVYLLVSVIMFFTKTNKEEEKERVSINKRHSRSLFLLLIDHRVPLLLSNSSFSLVLILSCFAD